MGDFKSCRRWIIGGGLVIIVLVAVFFVFQALPAAAQAPPPPAAPAAAPPPPPAQASPTPGATVAKGDTEGEGVAGVISNLLKFFTKMFGTLLLWIVSGIIVVSQYNDFISSLAVVNGWVVVRDVANMFFIVVLLVIAFGTILGQEEYHYKKLLPKLLLLAVLVNFSRTIVGIMIDFAQVVMLTFVNGYSAAAGGNFTNALQIADLLRLARESCSSIGSWDVAAAYALAFGMVLVSTVTVFIILAVLILRVIMLWLLTVLSPMAFLAGTFPQGQKYYAQWWEEFRNQVAIGPMLAFFLWLSLVTVGGGNAASQITKDNQSLAPTEPINVGCAEAGKGDAMMSYVISIMMLLAGVQMAQESGGMIAGVANKAKGFATRTAPGLLRGAAKLGYKAGKPIAGYGAEVLSAKTGMEFRPSKWKEAYKNKRHTSQLKRERAIASKSMERMKKGGRLNTFMGMMGSPQDFMEQPARFASMVATGGSAKERNLIERSIGARQRAKDYRLLAEGPGVHRDTLEQDADIAGRGKTDTQALLTKSRKSEAKKRRKGAEGKVDELEARKKAKQAEIDGKLEPVQGALLETRSEYTAKRKPLERDQRLLQRAQAENAEDETKLDQELQPLQSERQQKQDRLTAVQDKVKNNEQLSNQDLGDLNNLPDQLNNLETQLKEKQQEQQPKRATIKTKKDKNDAELTEVKEKLENLSTAEEKEVSATKKAAGVSPADEEEVENLTATINIGKGEVSKLQAAEQTGTSEEFDTDQERELKITVENYSQREQTARRIASDPVELENHWRGEKNKATTKQLQLTVAAGIGKLDDAAWAAAVKEMETAEMQIPDEIRNGTPQKQFEWLRQLSAR